MKLLIGNKNYSSWSLRPWLLLTHLLPAMRAWVTAGLAEHEFVEIDEPYRERPART